MNWLKNKILIWLSLYQLENEVRDNDWFLRDQIIIMGRRVSDLENEIRLLKICAKPCSKKRTIMEPATKTKYVSSKIRDAVHKVAKK